MYENRSMIEFKQIIGRGTRTYDGKDFFTIWDFVQAHENFNDPEWDGEPLEPVPPLGRPRRPDDPPPPDDPPDEPGEDDPPREKVVVKLADGKERAIRYVATTTYWSADGRPISAKQFLERLFGDLAGMVGDEDALRQTWSDPDTREHFLTQLGDRGYDQDKLNDIRTLVDAPKSDLFDVLGYVLFAVSPKTRHDRADGVRSIGMDGMAAEMKAFLLGILRAYEASGEGELATRKLGQFLTARYGSVSESKVKLGTLPMVRSAFRDMQLQLYLA